MGSQSIPAKLPSDYGWKDGDAAEPDAAVDESAEKPAPMDPNVDPTEITPAPTFSSRVLLVASLVSLAWLALAAAVIYLIGGADQIAHLSLTEWAGVAAGIAAPLSAIWLIALVTARVYPGQQRETIALIEAAEQRFAQTALETRTQLENIDSVLSTVTSRVEAMRQSFATEIEAFVSATETAAERTQLLIAGLAEDRAAMDVSSQRLADSGARARSEFAELTTALPTAEDQANRISEILKTSAVEARGQLQETEDLLAAVWTRSEEAGLQAKAAADGLTSVIASIAASANDAEGRLSNYAGALENSADAALAKTGEALDATRQGIAAQTEILAAAISKTSLELNDIGGHAVDDIAARLQSITQHASDLSQQIANQDANSQDLLSTVERGFSVLDAKLANAAQSSENVLHGLSSRITIVRGEIDSLTAPLDGTRGIARDIGNTISEVRRATEDAIALLAESVPGGAEKGMSAIDAIRGSVGSLMQDLDRLNERTALIATPVNDSRAAIDGMLSGLESQRESLEAVVASVRAELQSAQGMVSDISHATETTALGATSQLIEALGRVREVATQTSGTVRTALEAVVEEAREALSKATTEAVRLSVTEPVEEQIKALAGASARGADAAQAAAERLSRQLVSVAETAAAIEARVSEADAHLEEAQRTDLAHQSELLIEALNSSSIDIAKGLSTEVTEDAWKTYLTGDRGVFSRKAVQLLSRGDARDVAARYKEDGEFRDAVRRYIHDFEAMMRRVGADRSASALSMTLLSSDVGKLYVALAQATDRLR